MLVDCSQIETVYATMSISSAQLGWLGEGLGRPGWQGTQHRPQTKQTKERMVVFHQGCDFSKLYHVLDFVRTPHQTCLKRWGAFAAVQTSSQIYDHQPNILHMVTKFPECSLLINFDLYPTDIVGCSCPWMISRGTVQSRFA